MSNSGVSFAGLSSGIDTDSIIAKLMQLEKQPIARYQSQQRALNSRMNAYKSISAQLYGVQSASSSLNLSTTYKAVTSTSSVSDNVTVSTTSGAQTGTYNVTVNDLAASQQLSSSPQSSTSDPLGYTGQILINGKSISIKATDTLSTLASNINAANAGVSAGIISPTPGQNYLTIGSNTTGIKGSIQISDVGGGDLLANKLGLLNSAVTSPANPVGANGVGSGVFKSSGTSLGTLLGLTTPAAGTVQIGGQSIAIDLATDTLSSVASKITAANIPGISASVVSTTDVRTGEVGQQLQISGATGTTGTPSLTDSNNILSSIGILKSGVVAGRELAQAKDASFTVNGLTATRSSNTVSDAINGVTLNLLTGGGKSSTITVGRDIDNIKSRIQSFVSAFNGTMDTIEKSTSYDPETNSSGPLLGDAVAQGIADNLMEMVSTKISGVSGASVNLLADIGLSLSTTGRLTIDDAKLSNAVSTGNLTDIARLFKSDGVSSTPLMEFVGSTNDTQANASGQYNVRITKAAQQATVTAGFALVGTLAQDETLTFGGSLFGTTIPTDAATVLKGKSLTLKAGSNLADIVSTINSNSDTKDAITASIIDGKLSFTSKNYGSNVTFAVFSGVSDDPAQRSSGIGSTLRSGVGVDVAGEIGVLMSGKSGAADTDYNWEAATGTGQNLVGSKVAFGREPAGKSLGLKIRINSKPSDIPVNGTLTVGTMKFTRGVGGIMEGYLNIQNDAFKGAIGGTTLDLQAQVDAFDKDIARVNDRIKQFGIDLKLKYSSMEATISRIKASQSSLAKIATPQ